jgi:hypothetical protein
MSMATLAGGTRARLAQFDQCDPDGRFDPSPLLALRIADNFGLSVEEGGFVNATSSSCADYH